MSHGFSTTTDGVRTIAVLASIAVGFSFGCESPLKGDGAASLQRIVRASVERQVAAMSEPTPDPPAAIDPFISSLESSRAALDRLGPQASKAGAGLGVGPTLEGGARPVVQMSLAEAIDRAIESNLGIQHAWIQRDIAAVEIVRARAAFDVLVGAGADLARIDEPKPDVFIPLLPNPLPQDTDLRRWGFSTDLSKRLQTGGSIRLGYEAENLAFNGSGGQQPNPAWGSTFTLGGSQPLLRGFGRAVNRAEIELARNADVRAAAEVRRDLLDVFVNVERAYWLVLVARQELVAAEWLVTEGEAIRTILENRRGFDTTLAEYADSVATVERRKMRVIEAQRTIGNATDRLLVLLNDPDLPLAGDIDFVPSDALEVQPVVLDPRDLVMTALAHSPSIELAELGIDDASIREIVARNGRLPQLDLSAEVSWLGLADDYGSSIGSINGDFVDYILGLRFSQPIGNRAADSVFRAARLQRSGSIIRYRQVVQQVVLDVKHAIRDIRAGAVLVRQARSVRLAQAENLRALQAFQATLAGLTPEFLALLFQRQAGLSEAQLAEFTARAEYNIAQAQLTRALGTALDASAIEVLAPGRDR